MGPTARRARAEHETSPRAFRLCRANRRAIAGARVSLDGQRLERGVDVRDTGAIDLDPGTLPVRKR